MWNAVTDSQHDAGVPVSNGPLTSPDAATTVRVRDDEVELTAGPFAATGTAATLGSNSP